MSRKTRAAVLLLVLAVPAGAQVGAPQNVLLPGGTDLFPFGQEPVVAPDGSFVAVTGDAGDADVVIVELDAKGLPIGQVVLPFPAGNGVSAVNPELVASRRGEFLCCYGSSGADGDLVFLARDAGGQWFAQNVLFPAGNDAPPIGTRPAVSRDGDFIACLGSPSVADLVIIPVDHAAGFPQPGQPFNVSLPGGNHVAPLPVDPVIAPDGRSLALPGTAPDGDLAIVTVERPVEPANVLVTNVAYPGGNFAPDQATPVVVSPLSNWYATLGVATIGDVVVTPLDAQRLPFPAENVLWPAGNNNAAVTVPPSVSGDGRLLVVNGTRNDGDLVLLPIDPLGFPGTPANVPFPAQNIVPDPALPPAVANDAGLVVQRGADVIGDVVTVKVDFTGPADVAFEATNVLYPAANNVPGGESRVVLAPDASFCATVGQPLDGDLVVTPFDADRTPLTPENVLYPAANNVPGLAGTPLVGPDGLTVVTRGQDLQGDLVVTCLEVDPVDGRVRVLSTTNVLFPAANNTNPAGSRPVFSPSGQVLVSTGSPVVGDLVVTPLDAPAPYPLAPFDPGTVVPVRICSPGDAGRPYVAAASLARFPGIDLPAGTFIPLAPDDLLFFSLTPSNGVFSDMTGTLDADGLATAFIDLPALPCLTGAHFHFAFATEDPAAPDGLATISKPATFVLR